MDTENHTETDLIELPWDTAESPWADYVGNNFYSAAAQIVMDVCAAFLVDCRRLPKLAELRRMSKLQDWEIRRGCDNLRLMGWEDYAKVGDAIPAAPKPRFPSRDERKKEPIPAELRWRVWERDEFTCRNCGARQHLSVDHVIPESAGGPMTLDNLQTLCKRCNSSKGAKHPDDWRS